MIYLSVFKEYINADGVHIVWHDDFVVSEAQAQELLNEAAKVYANALKNDENDGLEQ